MKRALSLIMLTLLLCAAGQPVSAQRHRYTPPAPRRPATTGRNSRRHYYFDENLYTNMSVGLSAAHVNSDNPLLDGGSSQTGLNVGLHLGFGITPMAPLFFETGLEYAEKGGKGMKGDSKTTFDLNYLEVPLVLKYIAPVAPRTTIEPYLGGYLACGVGGKIKEYGSRTTYSSFGDGAFKRFDGGIRAGIGARFDLFCVDLGYDFGLSNIGDDAFDDAHNGAFYARVGLTF